MAPRDPSPSAASRPDGDFPLPVGFSPLPWYATAEGFDFSGGPPIAEVLGQIHDAGFGAVPADLPVGLTVPQFAELLFASGLRAAPGYFQAPFSELEAADATVQAARDAARRVRDLGVETLFIADLFGAEPRVRTPAVGAGFDPERLANVIEVVRRAATAIAEEGVIACLHQHVGTWIETPDELVAVLDAVDPAVLRFGPDTGHIAWAGGDPGALIERYRDRVGAVHLKDVHRDAGRRLGAYHELAAGHVWTEPGRGDLDLDRALRALDGFSGWFVFEVDVADRVTPAQSAVISATWARQRLTAHGTLAPLG